MGIDLDIAKLCSQSYVQNAPFDWKYVGNLWVGVNHYEDYDIAICRGSAVFMDWVHDFEPVPEDDTDLGMVDEGFFCGTRDVADIFLSHVSEKYFLGAHSLGGPHSYYLGAFGVLAGKPPISITTFGSPRPGGQKLADILKPVPIRAYRNRVDVVPEVPLGLGYLHPRLPLIQTNIMPPIDLIDADPDHSMVNCYQKAMEEMNA